MRILFFMPHTERAAGARYRVYQYLPYLRAAGIECDVAAFVDAELYEILYSQGNGARRTKLIAGRTWQRFRDLRRADGYDAYFVYRECYPFGPPIIERLLARTGKPILYDFDDAIFLPESSWLRQTLRRPEKTAEIVRLSSRVIVSTEHLRGFAAAYNDRVEVVPTSVDTHALHPRAEADDDRHPLRLGWIGSHSTAKYLEQLREPLRRLAARKSFELHVIGAGRPLEFPGVKLVQRRWALETENDEFRTLDIGLYPLASTVWELGKAGFKAIQYMSVAVPCVVSPVGVTREIVEDGVNGYWASSADEWLERLTQLLDDVELRRRMGRAGREKVERGYSLDVNAPRLVEIVRSTVGGS